MAALRSEKLLAAEQGSLSRQRSSRQGRGARSVKLEIAEKRSEETPPDMTAYSKVGQLRAAGVGEGVTVEGGSLSDILNFGKKAVSLAVEHGPGAIEAAKKGYKGLSEAYSAGKELASVLKRLRGKGYHDEFLRGMGVGMGVGKGLGGMYEGQGVECESDDEEEKEKSGGRVKRKASPAVLARGQAMKKLMAQGMSFGQASSALSKKKK